MQYEKKCEALFCLYRYKIFLSRTRLLDSVKDHQETNLDEVEKDLNTKKVLLRVLSRQLDSHTHTQTHVNIRLSHFRPSASWSCATL